MNEAKRPTADQLYRRNHPVKWFFSYVIGLILILVCGAILMAIYTHPVQP